MQKHTLEANVARASTKAYGPASLACLLVNIGLLTGCELAQPTQEKAEPPANLPDVQVSQHAEDKGSEPARNSPAVKELDLRNLPIRGVRVGDTRSAAEETMISELGVNGVCDRDLLQDDAWNDCFYRHDEVKGYRVAADKISCSDELCSIGVDEVWSGGKMTTIFNSHGNVWMVKYETETKRKNDLDYCPNEMRNTRDEIFSKYGLPDRGPIDDKLVAGSRGWGGAHWEWGTENSGESFSVELSCTVSEIGIAIVASSKVTRDLPPPAIPENSLTKPKF